ncbi:uncharacterized protein LDX57_006883 [Aspergillus melleus]|uniref:uncharacterized protein n=1 Tax=Aspergillus melleus TaxID=138277 RepID=UPI001E8E68E7|nr:uncharacterized protein LDX57_006883 [Aspergillus melleus]KAH8429216.1 hypothetical protein LDX57_006883 [Aspergillus melleus]
MNFVGERLSICRVNGDIRSLRGAQHPPIHTVRYKKSRCFYDTRKSTEALEESLTRGRSDLFFWECSCADQDQLSGHSGSHGATWGHLGSCWWSLPSFVTTLTTPRLPKPPGTIECR